MQERRTARELEASLADLLDLRILLLCLIACTALWLGTACHKNSRLEIVQVKRESMEEWCTARELEASLADLLDLRILLLGLTFCGALWLGPACYKN